MTARRPALLALAAAALAAGCEVPLDPIAESDRYFTVSGYLDTEADTQWVRVEPIVPAVDPPAGPLDVRVTLAGPGGEVEFKQRVMTLAQAPAHLFWTTADVETSQTYTVAVERPDGAVTRARVRTPDTDPPPTVFDGRFACPTRLTLKSTQPVGDAFVTYRIAGSAPRVVRVSLRNKVSRFEGDYILRSYFGSDAEENRLDPLSVDNPDLSAEIAIAVVTDAWPEDMELERALVPTDRVDVEGGLGFIGGTTVWRVPFQPGVLARSFDDMRPCFEPGRAQ